LIALCLAVASLSAPASAEAANRRTRSEAYFFFSLGVQARLLGNYPDALIQLRNAQGLDATSSEIRSETARTLREAGRNDEALAEAAQAVRLDPQDASAHLLLAQLYYEHAAKDGKPLLEKAATEYEQVLRLEPRDGETLKTLGLVYADLQKDKEAVAIWERYLELDPGSLEAHLRLGRHHLALGNAQAAEKLLAQAADLMPSAPVQEAIGDVLTEYERSDLAAPYYAEAIRQQPSNPRLRLKASEALLRSGQYQKALSEADQLLAIDPDNRAVLLLKAQAHRDLRQFEQALEAADRLLAKAPADQDAAFLRVTIEIARGDYDAAAKAIERLLARNKAGEKPENSSRFDRRLLTNLGVTLQQLSRYREAAQAFGRAAEAGAGSDPNLLRHKVQALVLAKDLDQALAEARAARKLFPDDPELVSLEATVLRERGELAGAVALIEGLRKKAPRNVDTLLQVADFYQKAHRYPEAEAALNEARTEGPRELRVLFQLGAVLERQKRHDAAEAAFREALGVKPDSAPVLNYLGYMNADRGVRVDEAVTLIQRALTLDPENGSYLDSLGWALYRLDRLDQAEQSLRRALAKQATNAVILDHLADVVMRRGSAREALELWRRALQGEDEGEELDRGAVQRKIREAQASLEVQTRRP